MIFGAGASERHKLPRFAACVVCRIDDRAGRAPAGVCRWHIYDYDADRAFQRSERMYADSFSQRARGWDRGYQRYSDHQ